VISTWVEANEVTAEDVIGGLGEEVPNGTVLISVSVGAEVGTVSLIIYKFSLV
jgi:hypothetical protein